MIFQADAIILTAIRAGLADIRNTPFLVDDILCQFTKDPYLSKAYGTQPERMKELLKKQINIVMETRLPDTSKLPAIVIKIGGGSEDPQKQGLGDAIHYETVDGQQLGVKNFNNIVAGPVTPISYDTDSGLISFDTKLENVFPGQYVYDEVNFQQYEIQAVLDDYSLVIDTDIRANFSNMTIRTATNNVKHQKKSTWFYEDYTFTSLSTDPNELMFLWSLILYILGRYKKTLFEARGLENMSFSYTPIYDPNPSDSTNILFARDVKISGRVEHSFIESTNQLIEGIDPNLLINAGADSSIAADQTNKALYEDQVSNQIWSMEKDIEYKKK